MYGDLDPLVEVDMTPKSSVTVTIHSEGRTVLKTVNLRWSLRRLKEMVAEFAGRPPSMIRLYHLQVQDNQGMNFMRHNERSLLNYRVEDGDEIHLE